MDDAEEIDYKMELDTSEDHCTLTLICVSDQPLKPEEYVVALKTFAARLDSLAALDEASNETMN